MPTDPNRSVHINSTTEAIANAPLPTRRTLRSRRSIPRQLVRFCAFNARMLRMVAKGHH